MGNIVVHLASHRLSRHERFEFNPNSRISEPCIIEMDSWIGVHSWIRDGTDGLYILVA